MCLDCLWSAPNLYSPGCLVHLSPPGIVGVIDDEEDLAPEQHQGGVGGNQALHHTVQTLQGVEQAGVRASLSTAILTFQKAAGCSRDPAEHSWRGIKLGFVILMT